MYKTRKIIKSVKLQEIHFYKCSPFHLIYTYLPCQLKFRSQFKKVRNWLSHPEGEIKFEVHCLKPLDVKSRSWLKYLFSVL